MGLIVNVSKSKMLVERLDSVMDEKTNRDYALSLSILILSLSIIIYQTVDYSLFPIQYAHGTTTSYNNERTVSAGQQVKINASKTGSSAGGPIEFTWTQTSGPSIFGDNKTIKGPVLFFKAPVTPKPVNLEFELNATRGQVTKSATVNVLVKENLAPVADVKNSDIIYAQDICGENGISLLSQKQIILDGSGSSDAEGGQLKPKWTQIGGAPVKIFNPDSITTTVSNDSICGLEQTSYLEFKLDVTDSAGETRSDNVTIPVIVNQLPIARISSPNEVRSGYNITLNASASSDAEGPIAEYDWSYKFNGESLYNKNMPKSPIVDFTAPVTTKDSTFHFQLRVKDSEGAYSNITEKIINVIPDYRPIADSGKDRFIGIGELCAGDRETEYLFGIPPQPRQITLDASNSTDAEGGPLKYTWTQIGGPQGQIVNENNGTASFSYDFCGLTETTNFSFMLSIEDSAQQTSSDNITITVG
jgi:hypothetical protein